MRFTLLFLLSAVLLTAKDDPSPAAKSEAPLNWQPAPGKMYVAERSGDCTIYAAGKASTPERASVYNAQGTIIQTEAKSHQTCVFSNGTGMYVDASTKVEITQFDQERFTAERRDVTKEPSVSHSETFVAHGLACICTNRLLSGTVMHYGTGLGSVGVNQQSRLAIQSTANTTTVYLLGGHCTVAARQAPSVPNIALHPGEMATINEGDNTVKVEKIPPQTLSAMEDKAGVACRARSIVLFDEVPTPEGPTLQAFALVPSSLPPGQVVSPASQ